MQLEDYFEFDASGEIRIQGHRVWMHDVLFEYIYREKTPKELVERFDTLNMEKILACLLYYHQHKEPLDRYMAEWLEFGRLAREKQRLEHPEWYERFRSAREQLERGGRAAS